MRGGGGGGEGGVTAEGVGGTERGMQRGEGGVCGKGLYCKSMMETW